MSHDSYLCGYLVLSDTAENAESAIAKLPSSEEDSWPYLSQSMFSVTCDPRYRNDMVHFAASYKDILGSWTSWEEKFEGFLQHLQWEQIRVIIYDCYRGDCLATWDHEYENGVSVIRKRKRYLNFKDDPEADFD